MTYVRPVDLMRFADGHEFYKRNYLGGVNSLPTKMLSSLPNRMLINRQSANAHEDILTFVDILILDKASVINSAARRRSTLFHLMDSFVFGSSIYRLALMVDETTPLPVATLSIEKL